MPNKLLCLTENIYKYFIDYTKHNGVSHLQKNDFRIYRCAPVSMGNTFQDLPRLRETANNTKRYI
jgi:hypothetical protein